jgi:hypothetical protein
MGPQTKVGPATCLAPGPRGTEELDSKARRQLHEDEVEALRVAAFDAMECERFEGARPFDDAKIPAAIQGTLAMSRYLAFYADVLSAAEAGALGPDLLDDEIRRDSLRFLLQASETKEASRAEEYRESPLEDPRPVEANLEATRALLVGLREVTA